MSSLPNPIFSVEEYLRLEYKAEFRSEYIQGTIVAMAGASRNHGWIVGAVLAQLATQLRGKSCGAAANDIRVYIEKYKVLTYPDIVVTCGPDVLAEGTPETLADATLIIEVLSPSTKSYDRGEKFLYYRGLPSFAEYLLLSQDAIRAEHHTRQPDGSWLLREISDPGAILQLTSIGCQLPLAELYERVQLETTLPLNPAALLAPAT